MSTTLSTLLPLINVPRAPQPLLVQALRNACRRFCRDTESWRVKLASFDTVIGQADYTLSTGFSDTLFLRVFSVKVSGLQYHETLWSVSAEGVLTFRNSPNKIDPVEVEAVLLPTTLCNEIANYLVDRWGEYIAAGAEAWVKSDRGSEQDPHPWFDPGGAEKSERKYLIGVGEAKAELFSGRQSGLSHIQVMGGIWS